MSNSRIPVGRVSTIYGDQSTQAATIVPSLVQAADGKSIDVVSDINTLNNNQKVVIDNLISETQIEYVYAQIQSNGNLQFVGNTLGWVDMSKMMLEIPVEFDVIWDQNKIINIMKSNADDALGAQNAIIAAIEASDKNLTWPNLSMLQPFRQFQIQLGENSIYMGRQSMQDLIGIKMVAQDNKLPVEELKFYTQLGHPNTYSKQMGLANNVGGYSNIGNDHDDPYIFSNWVKKLEEMTLNALFKAISNKQSLNQTKLAYSLCIPLKFLNSVFQHSAYLPPGIPFRFTLVFNVEPHFIGAISLPDNDTYFTTRFSNAITMKYVANTTNEGLIQPRILYRRHVINAQDQLAINESWARQPFLYNYQTFERKEEIIRGNQFEYEFDLAISQQRPTSIFIKIVPPDSKFNSIPIGSPITRQLKEDGNENKFFEWSNYDPSALDFFASDCSFITIDDLVINIGGQQPYRIISMSKNGFQFSSLADGNDLLNLYTNANVDQNLDQSSVTISRPATRYMSHPYIISINPGDRQHFQNVAADKGAVTIRIRLSIKNSTIVKDKQALPDGYRILVFKKVSEQFTINAQKNVEVIAFPAIKSSNNYLLTQTFNMS